jgi:hypothetical protein
LSNVAFDPLAEDIYYRMARYSSVPEQSVPRETRTMHCDE